MAVGTLVSYFQDPEGKQPLRLPTYPALDRTSVLACSVPVGLSGSGPALQRVALFPQAALPLWADASPQPVAQFAVYGTRQTSVSNPTTSVPFVFVSATTGSTTATVLTPTVVGFDPVPSGYAVVGQDASCGATPFVYVPAGGTYVIVVNLGSSAIVPSATSKVSLTFEAWTAPGAVTGVGALTVTFDGVEPAASVEVPTTVPLWMRPTSVDVAINSGGNTVNIGVFSTNVPSTALAWTADGTIWGSFRNSGATTTRKFYPITTAGPLATTPIPWNETRVTAAAITVNNVTNYLARGGSVTASRLLVEDSPITNEQLAMQAAWDLRDVSQSNPQDLYFGPADQQLGGFTLPPTAELGFNDYALLTTNSTATGNTSIPVFRLDDVRPFLAMVFNFPDQWALALRLSVHLEFRNARNLFPLGVTNIAPPVMQAAARQLAQTRPFRPTGVQNPRPSASLGFPPWAQRTPAMGRGQAARRPKQRRAKAVRQRRGQPAPPQQRRPAPQPQKPPQRKMRGGLDMYLEQRNLRG